MCAMVAHTLVSGERLDMSRRKAEAHFASWLGLCPDNRISGDQEVSGGLHNWKGASLPWPNQRMWSRSFIESRWIERA